MIDRRRRNLFLSPWILIPNQKKFRLFWFFNPSLQGEGYFLLKIPSVRSLGGIFLQPKIRPKETIPPLAGDPPLCYAKGDKIPNPISFLIPNPPR